MHDVPNNSSRLLIASTVHQFAEACCQVYFATCVISYANVPNLSFEGCFSQQAVPHKHINVIALHLAQKIYLLHFKESCFEDIRFEMCFKMQ